MDIQAVCPINRKSPTLVGEVIRLAGIKQVVDLDAASAVVMGAFLKCIDADVLPRRECHDANICERDVVARIVLGQVPSHSRRTINESRVKERVGFANFATERMSGHELGKLSCECV